jgi:sterol 24-C-methyltransferase
MRLVPKGTTEVSQVLNTGADALVAAGQMGIFTPMFFFLARKPLETAETL